MGLDIEAYQKVTYIRNDSKNTDCGEVRVFINTNFLKQSDGLKDGVYRFEGETFFFRAGSYTGYNDWRAWLSKNFAKKSPWEIWTLGEQAKDLPFYPLINFSDCDGVIGPETCKRLYDDFKKIRSKVRCKYRGTWELEIFEKFAKAFWLARNGGCVIFT